MSSTYTRNYRFVIQTLDAYCSKVEDDCFILWVVRILSQHKGINQYDRTLRVAISSILRLYRKLVFYYAVRPMTDLTLHSFQSQKGSAKCRGVVSYLHNNSMTPDLNKRNRVGGRWDRNKTCWHWPDIAVSDFLSFFDRLLPCSWKTTPGARSGSQLYTSLPRRTTPKPLAFSYRSPH